MASPPAAPVVLEDGLGLKAPQTAVLEGIGVDGRPHDVDAALVAAGAEASRDFSKSSMTSISTWMPKSF